MSALPFSGGYFGGVGFLEKQASGERDITSGGERELEGEERKGMTMHLVSVDCVILHLDLGLLFDLWVHCCCLFYFLWNDLRVTQLCFSFTMHHVSLVLSSFPWDVFYFTHPHQGPLIKI